MPHMLERKEPLFESVVNWLIPRASSGARSPCTTIRVVTDVRSKGHDTKLVNTRVSQRTAAYVAPQWDCYIVDGCSNLSIEVHIRV